MWPFDGSGNQRQFAVDERLPFVQAPQAEKPVELRSLEIQVVVSGLLAETTQTMRFYNPNGRNLEGTLTFPLPEGAAVCGYALDVGGQMVDGVVVPKQEARRILEAEIRKGVDPGLVEQVRGNVYRTRIYPIPAGGSRTIRVTYVSDLTVEGADAAYHLPLKHAARIERVSLRVEVVQAPVEPTVAGGLGNLTMNRWEDRWVAEATLARGRPAEDLQVRLPGLPDHFATVERTGDGEVFFCVSSRLSGESDQAPAWTPKRIAVAWDASGSRVGSERDITLLEGLLARWPKVIVDLVVFRDRVEPTRSFTIGKGGTEALLDHLRQLPCDGGTHLGGLDLSTPPHPEDEAWLLFTDGMGTVGSGLPTCGGVRVFPITSQADSHAALLDHVAAATGATHVNLLRTPLQAACDAICSPREALRVAETRGCEGVHARAAHGRLAIMGRLLGANGSLALVGAGAPGEGIEVSAESATPGRTVARAWAGREAQVAALVEGEQSATLIALGRRYGLVTPGTSLLVLESLEQYLEYDIEPPETLPEMRAAFHRHRSEVAAEKERARKDHIEVVLGWWQARIEWWETDFSAQRRTAAKQAKADAEAPVPRGAPPAQPMPAAAPPPAPMSEMAAESGAEIDFDEIADAEPALEERAREAKKEKGAPARAQAAITIKPWSPDTPYLAAMKEVPAEDAYRVYLRHRPEYAASPSFFLDCGDFLLTHDLHDLGVRVLSNLVETGLDDVALMRMYAWRLQQAGELDRAVEVLERVLVQREEEPQSHRDLALVLGMRWERDGRIEDAARAMALLYEVVQRGWERFPEIEIIALMELNRLIHLARQAQVPVPEQIDPRLRRHLDLDIRISLSWDADLTDVDLHVFEPNGDHAYYGHNRTDIGGLVSRDFTQGYGPEEYVLRHALEGTYTIKAHYFGSSQQSLTGPCTVIATVFTNYGRPDEQRQVLTLRLDQPSSEVVVGEIAIGAGSASGEPPPDWRSTFEQLRREMSVNEVIARLGQPAAIRGEEEMLLIYEPAPGVVLHVVMAPRLVAVRQLMEGATLDLL